MRKIFTLISLFFLLLSPAVYAQTVSGGNTSGGTTGKNGAKFQTKWKVNPFDNHVFIENNGQFDGKIKSGEKILYGVHTGKIDVYFTANRVVYRYKKEFFKKAAATNADPDDIKNFRREVYFLDAEWKGASNSVAVIAKNEQTYYYTYAKGLKGTIKANVFKQIIYKNLYPGIDAVYQFIEGKDGIKYALIVHPGADLSKVGVVYSGAKRITRNAQGDLVIYSDLDILTEHAPVTTYLGEPGNISISNNTAGNMESFKANENYDKTKTLVIDPWITDPLFANEDNAYDLDWDNYGNVYAYGGNVSLLQLVKVNKLGLIQWKFNADTISGSYYGDFCTDKVTGTSYMVQGFSAGQALKVNTYGWHIGTFPGNPLVDEMWRTEFDACNGNIVIGCGGTQGEFQAGILDSNMTSISPVNVMSAPNPYHDVTTVTIDPNGTQCYMTSAHTTEDTTNNNSLMQLPLPSLLPASYNVHERLGFNEVASVTYVNTNAMNGAAASPNWVYLYNGDTLRRYHKNTGAFVSQFPIRLNTPFQYGGVDVDACDNLFVGVEDSVYVLDSTYTVLAKVLLPNTVYDVHLGQNGVLYACGRGFVTQITEPISVRLISSASGSPSSCSACDGTATVNTNCGVSPYKFMWSNGNTNQTDVNMCAGIYSVKVTDGACPPHTDSAVVIISGKPGYNASVKDTNPGCALFRGNITAYPTGGTAPYMYSWSNGSTNQEDTGLVAGTYTCTITDNTGCKTFVLVTLINPIGPSVTVVPALDSLCLGSKIVLNASGAPVYKWKPSLGLSCNNCPNPTASPTVTTTYTVIGSDSNGCMDSVISKIKVYTMPQPVIKGKDSVCSGYQDTLSVKGGITYLWSNGATTTSILQNILVTQTITVTANNGPCTHDTSFVIHVVASIAKLTFNKDSICKGDSVNLVGSGGIEYKWSNGNTTTSIWVKPLTTQTYTLYAYAGSCRDSAVQKIKIIPAITASISISRDSICPHGSTTITAKGIGGQATYSWNTGATTSSITVSDTVTTTYTATVYGICDSTKVIKNVIVVPLPKPVIKGTNWKCKGVRDTLTVTSSTNPTKYVWSDGKTTTSITTGNINADSTIIVTGYNSLGCPNKDTFEIGIRQPPSPSGTVSIFCAGQALVLTASATGVNPPFSYKWSTGQTGSSITIDPGPDGPTTYTVQASNGCIGSGTVTAIPNIPNLNACCNQTLIIEDDSAVRNDTTILVASGNSTKYQWQENPNSGQITCIDPPLCDSVKVSTTVTTTYTVTGTDVNGCTTDQLVTINIEVMCFDIRVPNVITPTVPGPQGLNGEFYIRTKDINAWSIVIYDRWGKEMYSSTNQYEYWKGTTESGGKAPDGVYYYIIKGTCQNNTYKKDGFVQLIR